MRNCLYSAAPRVSRRQTSTNREALQHRTPSDRASRLEGVFGRGSSSCSRTTGNTGSARGAFERPGSPPIPAAAKPVLWLSYNLQHTRAVARAVDSCSTKAMKVVIALALPAAALKPVPVTMSAQQGRRNFVIGGARAVQHSRLQEDRGDNQHQN